MKVWTIIPARGLSSGKSRLARVLSPSARYELNATLLRHVGLAVGTAFGQLDHCVVISPDADVLQLARDIGAHPLRESHPMGLNAALDEARTFCRARKATHVLVLPSDLPMLSACAINAFVARIDDRCPNAIAPDRREVGTNALVLQADLNFPFSFGRGSFATHVSCLARLGAHAIVHRAAEINFDLDEPRDLIAWRSSLCNTRSWT